MIRLYLIDDHFLILDGFFSSFDLESSEFYVAGGSLTVKEALKKISPEQIDIIILDLFINNSDPIVNLSKIQNAFPVIPIVILSYENSTTWQVEMFRHGIRVYLNKSDSKEEMKQKLRRVAAGETVLPDHIAKIIIYDDGSYKNPRLDPEFITIINSLKNGLTIKEISCEMNISESAIEKRLHSYRIFFNAKTNIQLFYKLLSQGIPISLEDTKLN